MAFFLFESSIMKALGKVVRKKKKETPRPSDIPEDEHKFSKAVSQVCLFLKLSYLNWWLALLPHMLYRGRIVTDLLLRTLKGCRIPAVISFMSLNYE